MEEKAARDVYDSIKSLTCRRGKVEKLPAFTYQPSKGSPEEKLNGWAFYDPRKEFKRMGISAKDTDKGWRISTINSDYKVCRFEHVPNTVTHYFTTDSTLPPTPLY